MGTEAFLLFGMVFVVLLALGWRNGAFQRRGPGEADGRDRYPRVQPGGRTGESIRDPRSQLDAGDKLGRR
jgi:hypothetical protein